LLGDYQSRQALNMLALIGKQYKSLWNANAANPKGMATSHATTATHATGML